MKSPWQEQLDSEWRDYLGLGPDSLPQRNIIIIFLRYKYIINI